MNTSLTLKTLRVGVTWTLPPSVVFPKMCFVERESEILS